MFSYCTVNCIDFSEHLMTVLVLDTEASYEQTQADMCRWFSSLTDFLSVEMLAS